MTTTHVVIRRDGSSWPFAKEYVGRTVKISDGVLVGKVVKVEGDRLYIEFDEFFEIGTMEGRVHGS